MKYERNRALEDAITKVLSEGAKEKRELGKAAGRAGVKLGDPSLQKYGKKLFTAGSKNLAAKRAELDKAEKQKKISASVEKAIKVVTTKRAELDEPKSSPAPSRGKASDHAATLSQKLGAEKSPFPKAATTVHPVKPKIKIGGSVRFPEHEAVRPASAPEPEKKAASAPEKKADKSKRKYFSRSKGSSEETFDSLHSKVKDREGLRKLQSLAKTRKQVAAWNKLSATIIGEIPRKSENGKDIADRSYFKRAYNAVKAKYGKSKMDPAFTHDMAI